MLFETKGKKGNPVILFFHAMGVTGESSGRVAYGYARTDCRVVFSGYYAYNRNDAERFYMAGI